MTSKSEQRRLAVQMPDFDALVALVDERKLYLEITRWPDASWTIEIARGRSGSMTLVHITATDRSQGFRHALAALRGKLEAAR